MTLAIVRAIAEARHVAADELERLQRPSEPSLAEPEAGKPISHGQLIDISRLLKKYQDELTDLKGDDTSVVYSLDSLLKGSKVYIPPRPPKKEPVSIL